MKHVITGPASSGKTSVIEELKKRGFKTTYEVARQVILGMNKRPEELDHKELNRQVYLRQLGIERHLPEESTFLDRGLIDPYAYCAIRGVEIPEEMDKSIFPGRYKSVFLLRPLSLQQDGVRFELSEEELHKTYAVLLSTYGEFGYNVVEIPVLPIKDRVDMILKTI